MIQCPERIVTRAGPVSSQSSSSVTPRRRPDCTGVEDRNQAFVAGGREAAAPSAPRGAEVRRSDQPAGVSSSTGPSSGGNPGAAEVALVPWVPRDGGGSDGPSTKEELPVICEEIPDVDSEGDIVMNVNHVAKTYDLEIMGIANNEVYKLTGRRNVLDVSEVFS